MKTKLLTIDEVAAMMKERWNYEVSTETLARWWPKGEFPEPIRFGGKKGSIRWIPAQIEKFMLDKMNKKT